MLNDLPAESTVKEILLCVMETQLTSEPRNGGRMEYRKREAGGTGNPQGKSGQIRRSRDRISTRGAGTQRRVMERKSSDRNRQS